jgi:hypothetical protein
MLVVCVIPQFRVLIYARHFLTSENRSNQSHLCSHIFIFFTQDRYKKVERASIPAFSLSPGIRSTLKSYMIRLDCAHGLERKEASPQFLINFHNGVNVASTAVCPKRKLRKPHMGRRDHKNERNDVSPQSYCPSFSRSLQSPDPVLNGPNAA